MVTGQAAVAHGALDISRATGRRRADGHLLTERRQVHEKNAGML